MIIKWNLICLICLMIIVVNHFFHYRTNQESEQLLCGTFSKGKKELLESYGCIYNKEEAIYRKGSIFTRAFEPNTPDSTQNSPILEHVDLIGDAFWASRPWILGQERQAKTDLDLEDL